MYRKKLMRRRLAFAAAGILVVVAVVAAAVAAVMSCGAEEAVVSAGAGGMESYGTVPLSLVEAPQFLEDFCTLDSGSRQFAVQWGEGSGCVMWYESGYPGFNMPMVVEGCGFTGGSSVTLRTSYGEFVYGRTGSGFAFKEGHTLIDLATEESVISFGRSQETLYLYDLDTLMYTVYSKEAGTDIVL